MMQELNYLEVVKQEDMQAIDSNSAAPDDIACCQRGKVRMKLGEYQAAVEDFTQALKLNPSLSEAYYNRSLSQYNLGNLDLAFDDLESSVKCFLERADIVNSEQAINLAREYQIDRVRELATMTPYELGESNREEAIDFLVQYLASGSQNEKRSAASAIRKLAMRFKATCNLAVPYLLANLSEPGPQVRQYTLKALDKLALPKSAAFIIGSIAQCDEAEYNRTLAGVVLRKIK